MYTKRYGTRMHRGCVHKEEVRTGRSEVAYREKGSVTGRDPRETRSVERDEGKMGTKEGER